MEGYHALPLVTRTYATLAFVTTAACSLEIFSSHKLYYNTKAIMNGEPWRLATNFLWFGNFGVDFVFHMFFLLRYSKSLEEGSFRGRSADYLWMLLLGSVFMIVAAPFLDVMFLGPSLTFMSLLGVFTFTAPYLPWVLLALSIVLGNSPYIDLLGIAAGHIYYFLMLPGLLAANAAEGVGPTGAALALLDFRKAYDTIDRGFLIAVMEAVGVGDGVLAWTRTILTHTAGALPDGLIGECVDPAVRAALLAGPMRRMLDGVQALGPVARITGRVQTAELWGAEAPLWANPLLQLELPAAQRSVQWREPTGDAAGHALFSPTDAARWLVDGLARVRDALPGMRTVTDLCVLWAWLAAVDMVFAGLRGLEAAVPTLWRMPLLNARKEPIWRLWDASRAAEPAPRLDSKPALPALLSTDPPLARPYDEAAVCKINQAILLYGERRYAQATRLLSPLLANLDVLDEGAALHVCCLLLDMQLQQQQVAAAGVTLAALEKACPGLQDCYLAADAADVPAASADADAAGRQPSFARAPPDVALPAVSKWGSSTMASARLLLAQHGRAPPQPPPLGALMRLFRARHAMAGGDLRSASTAVRGLVLERTSSCGVARSPTGSAGGATGDAGSATAGGTPPAVTLAHAHLELLRGESSGPWDAVSALRARQEEQTKQGQQDVAGGGSGGDAPLSAVLLNDLGVVRSARCEHHLAAAAFRTAAAQMAPREAQDSGSGDASSSAPPLPYAAAAAEYNLGVQALVVSDFSGALLCFQRCLGAEVAAAASGSGDHDAAASGRVPLTQLRAAGAAAGLYAQQTELMAQYEQEQQEQQQEQEQQRKQEQDKQTQERQAQEQQGEAGALKGVAGREGGAVPGPSPLAAPPVPDASLLTDALAWVGAALTGLAALHAQQQASIDAAAAAAAAAEAAADDGDDPRPGGSEAQPGADQHPHHPHAPLSWLGHEWDALRAAAHTTAAYAHLLAGRHADALQCAQHALAHAAGTGAVPGGGGAPEWVGAAACYAAEALCALGRHGDARSLLDEHAPRMAAAPAAAAASEGGTAPSGSAAPGGAASGGLASSPVEAAVGASRAAHCTNLAAADPSAARSRALPCEARAQGPTAALLSAYADMMSGRGGDALETLRALAAQ
ncbi:hypothetical protein FOA52_003630 [Chlamydomonas sp. UWO 241]|nr:hypothetical protein FOA52_003630 [Chlamydomonas sp. UWO 241]